MDIRFVVPAMRDGLPDQQSCSVPDCPALPKGHLPDSGALPVRRPKLHTTLAALRPGDTLVIYKPDRVARSMKELLVFLEDQLHARAVTLLYRRRRRRRLRPGRPKYRGAGPAFIGCFLRETPFRECRVSSRAGRPALTCTVG